MKSNKKAVIQIKRWEEGGEKDLSTHNQTFPKGTSRQIVHTPVLCVALRGSVVNGVWTGTEEGALSSLLWCPPQLHPRSTHTAWGKSLNCRGPQFLWL